VRAKYEFIDAQKAYYPVVKMCTWLGVSRSGFYEWLDRGTSATARRRQELCLLIAKAFTDSDGTYGHRRVHAQLTRWGVQVSLELVRALMRALGLQPCQPRPWRPTTTVAGAAGPIPDLLDRDFTATTPGTKLVGDITYIPTWEGFLYLATVIDLCTKECVGYAIADHMRTELVTDALDMAARNHRLTTGAVFHTDRGSPIHVGRVRRTLLETPRHAFGRADRCVFRQCCRGIVQCRRQGRTRQPHRLSHQKARAKGHHPVHRTPLQYSKASLRTGIPNPARGLQRLHQHPHGSMN